MLEACFLLPGGDGVYILVKHTHTILYYGIVEPLPIMLGKVPS
jgi:hypothetical protein